MVKQASMLGAAEKAGRWLFTKKLKAKMFGSQAGQARKIIEKIGPKLDNKTHDHLSYIARGGKHRAVNAKKLINETARAHKLREFSAAKPAIAAGTAIGVGLGMSGKKGDPQANLRLRDRSPHLTQDPSRVLY